MSEDASAASRLDRAAGVLLGQAVGDALGVPYEFATPPGPGEEAAMLGGGLGDFAPGEWSDDTAMAVAVAEGLAAARRGEGSVDDEIAARFLAWYDDGPPDIGNQTAAVLGATRRALAASAGSAPGAVLREQAEAFARAHPHSAGNGALMRTGVVALAHLHDRTALAEAARQIASLTHADPLAGDSCVLWCESVRVAVQEARLSPEAGTDLLPAERRDQWGAWLADALDLDRAAAEAVPGRRFTPNGFTVTALQAAWAAIASTEQARPIEGPIEGPTEGVHAAVRIGDDTDTVAAIAGTLLGARWGASAWPSPWREAVHGWPGRRAEDLEAVARALVGG